MRYRFLAFQLCTLLLFNCIPFISQARISAMEYIDTYKYEAVNEMLEYGIPASITIAQGILESDCGNSPLAVNAKNHFGIKCHVEWAGPTYIHDDDKKDECFRVYGDPIESYRDHSLFLKERPRYAALFKLDKEDYKAWAQGLKQAGYATNPIYAEKLIKIIEENQLHKFDKVKNIKAVKHLREIGNTLEVTPFENSVNELTIKNNAVQFNNKTKYIIAQKGDTYYSIAKEYELDIRLLYAYNDLRKTDELKIGQFLYQIQK
jgi:LysM repeat protein